MEAVEYVYLAFLRWTWTSSSSSSWPATTVWLQHRGWAGEA